MTEAYKIVKEKIYQAYEEKISSAENTLKEQQRICTKRLDSLTNDLKRLKAEFEGFCKEQEFLNNNTI